jgi:hypothetical protein
VNMEVLNYSHRIPFKKIWCHSGVTTLALANANASSLYAPVSNVPPSAVY